MKKFFEEKRKRWAGRLLFAAVLAAMSVIGTGRLTVSAASAGTPLIDGDFVYRVNDGGDTVSLIIYNGGGGVVQIPGTVTDTNDGSQYPVVNIGDMVFYEKNNITSVSISDGVTSIGALVFGQCGNLESISIPNSVTSIGDAAFMGCSSLTSVTIPNSVTSIGDTAFYNCTSLTSVSIPEGVTSIGDGMFANCSSLTSVSIPDSVTSIGRASFQYCSSLESVSIPNGVTNIEMSAFIGCSSLTSVTIPNSVTSIGDAAFVGCHSDLILWHNGNANVISYATDNNLTAYQTDYVVDITQQPASQEVTEGDKASFTVAATAKSGGAISYQWEVSKDGGNSWDKIEGATSVKYELTDVKTEWSGWQYRCAVTESGYGIGYSAAAALTVTEKETGSGTAVPGTGIGNSSGTAVPVTGTGNSSGTAVPVTGTENSSDAGGSGTKSDNGGVRYGKNVQTGDEANAGLWMGLLAVSALLVILSVIAGRKRKA